VQPPPLPPPEPDTSPRLRSALIVGGIILGLLVCGLVASSLMQSASALDSAAWHAAFVRDRAAFTSRYDKKTVTVRGRVVGTERSLGETCVVLGVSGPGAVVVRFTSPADAARAAGSRGVVVKGVVALGDGPYLFVQQADLLSAD
jgi:hypothetical protein